MENSSKGDSNRQSVLRTIKSDMFKIRDHPNKHRKRFLTPVITREIQIKATLKYHLTPLGWQVSKEQKMLAMM